MVETHISVYFTSHKFKRYTFSIGIMKHRTVIARATSIEEARLRARAALDLQYERTGKEAPVAWDLTLEKIEE